VSPRGRLASRSKLRPPALHCELRAQALRGPSAPRPQASTTDTECVCKDSKRRGRQYRMDQTVAPRSQSHRAHVYLTSTKPASACHTVIFSGSLQCPSVAPRSALNAVKARCAASRFCCVSRRLSSCDAAIWHPLAQQLSRLRLRSIQRQHDAMQLSLRLSVRASDRHAGASEHMDEACFVGADRSNASSRRHVSDGSTLGA
jgi:hypothetical protein